MKAVLLVVVLELLVATTLILEWEFYQQANSELCMILKITLEISLAQFFLNEGQLAWSLFKLKLLKYLSTL